MVAKNYSIIGVFRIHDVFLDIENDGSVDGLCSLKGVMGNIFNLKLKKLSQRGFRCQFVPGDRLGSYNETSHSYDGLLGSLQRGELTSVAMPVFYPLNDTRDTFSYSIPLLEDTMTIFSVYNTSTQVHMGDVFDMFASVPDGLWVGFVACFLAFVFVSCLGGRLFRKAQSGVWMSVCAFLDQDTHQDYYPKDARYFAILSIVVMSGLFFIMTFRGGCISTDLVTVDKPVVVDSYDRIIANGVYSGFGKITPEWEKFANAPTGSKERRIFEKSFDVSFSPTTFLKLLNGLIHQKKVIIGRPFIANLAAMANLAAPTWPSECAAYVAPDENAKKYSTVFVSNPQFKHAPINVYGDTLTKRLSQHGIQQYAAGYHTLFIVIDILFGRNALPPSSLNKISSHITSPSSYVIDIGWLQYRRFMFTTLLVYSFGSVILLIEIVSFQCWTLWKRQGRRRRRHNRGKPLHSYGINHRQSRRY